VLALIGFEDAALHLVLATIFTLVLAPTALFPLFVMADRLETLLRIDNLTGLPNRRAFFEKADEVFKGDRAITMMMIDVDHFKGVNDRYGHEAGDRVLRAVARSIRQTVEETPGVGTKFAARLGGEEFAVLVEDLHDVAVGRLATELVKAVRKTVFRGVARGICVTVSAGVARRRQLYDTPDEVLRAADGACYLAKRLGRDQWRNADEVETSPDRKIALRTLKLSLAAAAS
jgi:diguanylate cyclase (GGDEF)-like protein